MADQPNIFKENEVKQETPAKEQDTDQVSTTTSDNPYEDLLREIKNEDGNQKYKTVEDALVGLRHAQEYIPKVKDEKTEAEKEVEALRAELEKLKHLEETVYELTQREEQTSTNGVALNEEEIAKLVERTLTSKQQEELRLRNQQEVVSQLTNKFGQEAEKKFYDKAQELGMSVEEMNTLAARTPKAVLTLMGVDEPVAHKQTQTQAPTEGSVSSEGFQPKPQSYLGREANRVTIGATREDISEAVSNAAKLAEELRERGLSTYDLTDPKIYSKYFK